MKGKCENCRYWTAGGKNAPGGEGWGQCAYQRKKVWTDKTFGCIYWAEPQGQKDDGDDG